MGAEHKEPKHLKVVFFTNLPYGKEVAQGFGHLSVVNIQECIVHPVFSKGLSVGCLALRDLVFMVRKDQILSAGVDINLESPRYFFDITEHSICQPGRPLHQGDSQ